MNTARAQIDRICESPKFVASPKLASLLRFLAAEAFSGAIEPPGQRAIAAALQLPDPESRSAGPAVRMQVGRLRKLLDRYYEHEGIGDPILVELPLRDYRLRFLRDGRPISVGQVRSTDSPVLAVTATLPLGAEAGLVDAAEALSRHLIAVLGSHATVTTIGPIVPPRVADRSPGFVDLRIKCPAGSVGPAEFVLDTAIQAAGDAWLVLASLSTGAPPQQLWSNVMTVPAVPSDAIRSMQGIAAKLAAAVADECGVIVRAILKASAGKPVEEYSVVDAVMSLWRYWITGSQDDLVFARRALDHALTLAPESPLALGFWVAAACQEYTSSLDPRARLPDLVLERAEQARRHALGHPWIELVRGYALWLSRHPAGLPAIIDQLEAAPASATFRGMLAAIRIASDIDPARGRRQLAAAFTDSPQPLLWFHFCAAIHDLEQGDLDAAERELARIDAPSRPEPVVLRACVASARGDLDGARRILAEVTDALPEFAAVGEVILRRWLHDRHVDTIAATLEPLGVEWFQGRQWPQGPRPAVARG